MPRWEIRPDGRRIAQDRKATVKASAREVEPFEIYG